MAIGKKISELRKKHNLTQEKLADKIGVSRQTLSNWESDITSPDLVQAGRLSKELKISLDELVDNDLEIECKDNSSNPLINLIDKICYLNLDDEYYDVKLQYNTPVKVIDVSDDFIKIKFDYKKESITKLIDINLIVSIKVVEEGSK